MNWDRLWAPDARERQGTALEVIGPGRMGPVFIYGGILQPYEESVFAIFSR